MKGTATFPEEFLMRIHGLRKAMVHLSPIMPTLEEIAWDDNAEGLLAGTDKDGRPLAPLSARTLANPRRGPGPPLIPRFRASRFIANYRVGSIDQGGGNWVIIGAWENILSKSGVPFAPFHFEGAGRLPQRDLRGIRPDGKQKIQSTLSKWLIGQWRGGGAFL